MRHTDAWQQVDIAAESADNEVDYTLLESRSCSAQFLSRADTDGAAAELLDAAEARWSSPTRISLV